MKWGQLIEILAIMAFTSIIFAYARWEANKLCKQLWEERFKRNFERGEKYLNRTLYLEEKIKILDSQLKEASKERWERLHPNSKAEQGKDEILL